MRSINNSPREGLQGEYMGVVVSTADPNKRMRVQVRVNSLFDGWPDSDLPWATYRLPVGAGVNKGGFIPVEVGDNVWVDFPFDGDTRRPRIVGSVHEMPDESPNIPHESWAGDSCYQHKRTGNEPKPDPAKYHEDVVLTYNNVLIEITKAGAFRATQKATGTGVEIAVDGSITIHSENNIFGSAPNTLEIGIGQTAKVDIGQSMKLSVPALEILTSTIKIEGNVTQTGSGGGTGTVEETVNKIQHGNLTIQGSLSITGGVSIGGSTTIGGDLTTSGNSSAGSRSGGAI